jgi:hypothetical protein
MAALGLRLAIARAIVEPRRSVDGDGEALDGLGMRLVFAAWTGRRAG